MSAVLDESEVQKLRKVVGEYGELIYAQRSGSWSFNLSVASSDVDYFGVFVAPDALKVKAKTLDHSVAGNAGDDWVLYELGMYIELLAKGNPKVVEPLYAPSYRWTTPLWDRVVTEFRPLVLNQCTISAYLSFASFEYHTAVKKLKSTAAATPDAQQSQANATPSTTDLATTNLAAAGKPLYHALRLTREAQRMLNGEPPRVWWDGAEREALMAIRTGQSGQSIDRIAEQAKTELDAAKHLLDTSHLPKHFDHVRAGEWLVNVRLPTLIARAQETHFVPTPAESEFDSPNSFRAPYAQYGPVVARTRALLAQHGFPHIKILTIAPMGAQLWRHLQFDPVATNTKQVPHPQTGSLCEARPSQNEASVNEASTVTVTTTSSADPAVTALGEAISALGSPTNPPGNESHPNQAIERVDNGDEDDWLVVFKLPVSEIVNPHKNASNFFFEHPQTINVTGGSKYGSGVWAIEVESALSSLLRHHVLFESLVLLPNDERYVEGMIWQHEEWRPYAALLAKAWKRGEMLTLGLLSHYLGLVTGLLRSTVAWPKVSDAAGEKRNGSGGAELEVADLEKSVDVRLYQAKAYRLARRLFEQCVALMSVEGEASAKLLASESCVRISEEVLSISESPDATPAKEVLLARVAASQAELKGRKKVADLSAEVKTALSELVRRGRYATLPMEP